MSSNPYDQLLAELVSSENKSITIEANITASALRKGMATAISSYNMMQSVMDLPELTEHLAIETVVDGKYKLSLVPPEFKSSNRFKSKIQFKVVK